jgi:hypothetical protein
MKRESCAVVLIDNDFDHDQSGLDQSGDLNGEAVSESSERLTVGHLAACEECMAV